MLKLNIINKVKPANVSLLEGRENVWGLPKRMLFVRLIANSIGSHSVAAVSTVNRAQSIGTT